MAHNRQKTAQSRTLERAAKYICTAKCGLCPMVVEKYPCTQQCTLQTKPWQCWLAYFAETQQPARQKKGASRPAA